MSDKNIIDASESPQNIKEYFKNKTKYLNKFDRYY